MAHIKHVEVHVSYMREVGVSTVLGQRRGCECIVGERMLRSTEMSCCHNELTMEDRLNSQLSMLGFDR